MKKIAVLFVLILAFCGCENSSEPSLPKENLEERFSCKVDGKLFVAKPDNREMWGARWLTIEHQNSGESPSYFLSIGAIGFDTSDIVGLNLGCDSVLNINTGYPIKYGDVNIKGEGIFEPINQGTLILSHLGGGKISGTFQFTAKERGGTKIINVTEGKFNSAYISR